MHRTRVAAHDRNPAAVIAAQATPTGCDLLPTECKALNRAATLRAVPRGSLPPRGGRQSRSQVATWSRSHVAAQRRSGQAQHGLAGGNVGVLVEAGEELAVVQVVVETSSRDEFVVVALLDDVAGVHHQNRVGVSNGG